MSGGVGSANAGSSVVARQLRDAWDAREYEQLISDNIRSIATFLSNFELACRSKLADLSDKVTVLERKVEFLEARGVRQVNALKSTTPQEARLSVLKAYKTFQRTTPRFWWDHWLTDIPLPVFRHVIKGEFLRYAHLTDLRLIDRKVVESYQHLDAYENQWYNPDHVRNFLLRENLESKPKDFLSKFLQGKE